jgi:hypothetical protein
MSQHIKRKRGGQPKPEAERKRNSVTIRVLDSFRERIEAEAAKSQRSVSEEIAYRVQMSYVFGPEVESAQKTQRLLAKETDDTIKAAMHRQGWGKVVDPRYGGAVYIPPGQHPLLKSGFISEAEAAAAPVPVIAMTEEALSRVVETAVANALARAKLTIGDGK